MKCFRITEMSGSSHLSKVPHVMALCSVCFTGSILRYLKLLLVANDHSNTEL